MALAARVAWGRLNDEATSISQTEVVLDGWCHVSPGWCQVCVLDGAVSLEGAICCMDGARSVTLSQAFCSEDNLSVVSCGGRVVSEVSPEWCQECPLDGGARSTPLEGSATRIKPPVSLGGWCRQSRLEDDMYGVASRVETGEYFVG